MNVLGRFRKALVAIVGAVLMVIGLIGFALPLLPGTVFVVAALLVWSTEFRGAKRMLVRIRRWISERNSKRAASPSGETTSEIHTAERT